MAAQGHSGCTLVVEGAGLDPGVNMGFLKSSLATDFGRWKSISPNEDIDGLDVSHENSAGFASDGVLTRSAWPITLRHAATLGNSIAPSQATREEMTGSLKSLGEPQFLAFPRLLSRWNRKLKQKS